jgi:DHA2 family multidrug resistance protein
LLRRRDPPPVRRPVDFIGFALLVIWIGALQLTLDRGQELDWFGSPVIVTLVLISGIGFTAFLIWELTDRNPIVHLRVFRHLGFSLVILILSVDFGAFFGSVLLLSLWLQTNMGYNATWAGTVVAPGGLSNLVILPLVAWLSSRADLRLLISMGLACYAGEMFWQAHFASTVTLGMVIASQVAVGAFVAFFFSPAMTLALGFVPPDEVPAAVGLLSFTRTAAVAFATAIASTNWQNQTAHHRVAIVDAMHAWPALDRMTTAGLAPAQAVRQLDALVQNQAVMLATNDSYLIFAAAMAFGSLCIWLVPRAHAIKAEPAPHGG